MNFISCGCLLLFKSRSLKCDNGSDGISAQSKFDGHTLKLFLLCRELFSYVMYCEVCCCLHVKYKYLTHECMPSKPIVSDTYPLV